MDTYGVLVLVLGERLEVCHDSSWFIIYHTIDYLLKGSGFNQPEARATGDDPIELQEFRLEHSTTWWNQQKWMKSKPKMCIELLPSYILLCFTPLY